MLQNLHIPPSCPIRISPSDLELLQLERKDQECTSTSMAASITADPIVSLLIASRLFWSLTLDQMKSLSLVFHGVRVIALCPKDVEMDSSKVQGGAEENRICHGIWKPKSHESVAVVAQVDWKALQRHHRDGALRAHRISLLAET